jgi:AcrR family transcriptional regulator
MSEWAVSRRKSAERISGRGSADTARRFMDAAESLFIRRGYEGTSIRDISAKAKMNLATVVYHWGTKETLFRDVCRRRFEPIQAEQIRRLIAIDALGADIGPDHLDAVVRALVEPPLLMQSSSRETKRVALLYGRALTDPSPVISSAVIALLSEGSQLFLSLLTKCIPDLPREILHRRYICALGAFTFTQGFGYRVTRLDGSSGLDDWPALAETIVEFMKAGLTVGRDPLQA